ncbi:MULTISPECIES: transposase family protein [unclassified Streptomyces]|uniref:transposase family protein n=1 Tax=unclassified Streptomyces TaxID=2593676 RepID=UPI002474ABBC|nr:MULTISPECIES: transposase family protein [unclassified Streptomyces]
MCRQSASICPIKSPTRQHRFIGPLTLRLQSLADPQHRRGKRHSFVSVLLIACSAVLTGARSFAAIGQWARSAPRRTRSPGSGPAPRRSSMCGSHRVRRPCAGC